MPRKGPVPPREIAPDPIYNNVIVAKLINKVMKDGKKSTAEWIVYEAFKKIQEETGQDPLEFFLKALENLKPIYEVRPRRVGGATYQIPMEVRAERRRSLALRWLLASARSRNGKSMAEKLAAEFLDAGKGQGAAVKKKDDTHRMAEANKAFAHYRW